MSPQPVIDARVIELEERMHRELRLAAVLEHENRALVSVPVFHRIERHHAKAADYQRRLKEITG